MIKVYKISLLLIIFIFLSTFNPISFSNFEKSNDFFTIKNINIVNNHLIKEKNIKEKLKEVYKKNIFSITTEDIIIPLKNIDFLHSVKVDKKYPNTIIIKIIETKPVAKFTKGKTKYLLDNLSNIVLNKYEKNFNQLPNIFGDKAEINFINFSNKLKKNNFPRKKILNYYYFQIERWDIQLLNNKIIKFPYNKVDKAIKKSMELLDNKEFQNYNIIDLRVDGKIIVE
jgi:cell division septal protein FtsQ